MHMRRGTRGQRGAAMVEFAIVLPLLLLLVFGMIDFASIYNDYQSVRQGAGAGDRQAVVNQSPVVTSPNCNSTNVSDIHMSSGAPAAGSEAAKLICYTKARVGLNMDNTRVALVFNAPLTAGQPLMVCVQYPISSITGYLARMLGNKVLNSRAETIVELLAPATPDASMSHGTVAEDPITSWPTTCSAGQL
jgi:Flp pilus assembly protein TadG